VKYAWLLLVYIVMQYFKDSFDESYIFFIYLVYMYFIYYFILFFS